MTPEEAYQEAKRRIQEAEDNKSVELVLSDLSHLSRLPPELVNLTSLQSLNLSYCHRLSGDLSQLAALTSLQSLDLSYCDQLSGDLSQLAALTSLQSLYLCRCDQLSGDLSQLAALTSLQSLNLSYCHRLSGDLSPLAALTSLQSLYLSECRNLSGDLSPLAALTSLQSLRLSECRNLSGDLSPLAALTSLQSLRLSECRNLSGDLSPLAALTSLQSLRLDQCTGIREFAPLEPLLPQLQELSLYGCPFDDLPSEICGQWLVQNVIREVRAHFADLRSGQFQDAELKLFILGNGGVGKTQLSRRLQGLNFDERIPTTHGIELNFIQTNVDLEHFKGPVRLNAWDFGGQDIYHGSHTLFLHGQAIFLLLWKQEEAGGNRQGDSQHRPITYWLDYFRAVAGPDNPLIVCQSQCDTPEMRAPVPVRLSDWAGSSWIVEASARTDFGLGRLKATLQDAAWACLHKRPPPPIGKGRLEVRDRLREMLANNQQLPSTKRKH